MEIYENRLQSFVRTRWPYITTSTYPSYHRFATAGFYAQPSSDSKDSVACYLCQKHLDGWEESDDPWIAHIEHGKIKVTSSSRRKAEEILKCPLVSLESYPSRLATFVNWPHKHKASMKATPETLSEAGFYFCPTQDSQDLTRCYHCSIALDFWDPNDDPLHEHLKRNPECPHLNNKPKAPYEYSSVFGGKYLTVTPAAALLIPETPSRQRRRADVVIAVPSTIKRKGLSRKMSMTAHEGKDDLENWSTKAPDTVRKPTSKVVQDRRRAPKDKNPQDLALETPSISRKRQASGPVNDPIPSVMRTTRASRKKLLPGLSIEEPQEPKHTKVVPPPPSRATIQQSIEPVPNEAQGRSRQEAAHAPLEVPNTARRMVTRKLAATGAKVDTPVDIFTTNRKNRTKKLELGQLQNASLYVPETPSSRKAGGLNIPMIQSSRDSWLDHASSSSFAVPEIPKLLLSPRTPATIKKTRRIVNTQRSKPPRPQNPRELDTSDLKAFLDSELQVKLSPSESQKFSKMSTINFFDLLSASAQEQLQRDALNLSTSSAKRLWEFILKDGAKLVGSQRPDLDLSHIQDLASQSLHTELDDNNAKTKSIINSFSEFVASRTASLSQPERKLLLGDLFSEDLDLHLCAFDFNNMSLLDNHKHVLHRVEEMRAALAAQLRLMEDDQPFDAMMTPKARALPREYDQANCSTVVRVSMASLGKENCANSMNDVIEIKIPSTKPQVIDLDSIDSVMATPGTSDGEKLQGLKANLLQVLKNYEDFF